MLGNSQVRFGGGPEEKEPSYLACGLPYRVHGKQYKRKIGPNRKLAEQILHDIELKALRGEYLGIHEAKKITVADFVEEYLAWAGAHKSAGTHALNEHCANRLKRVFTGALAAITARQVEQYIAQRRASVAPATINIELSLLKHMCVKAVEWNYLKVNPLKSVKFLKEPPGRVRYLTREEMDALVAACARHLRPIVVMGLHTGMRRSEMLGLTWADIDFATRSITLRRTKSNRLRVIPINQTLYEELQRLPRHLHSPYVFCNDKGGPFSELRHAFQTACRRAGIVGFRFHDLRHTFASHLVMNGVNLRAAQQLLGHQDIRMTLRYSHLSQEHLQAAVGTLDRGGEVGTMGEHRGNA
jgi:integrase